jgi:hypothetical protein
LRPNAIFTSEIINFGCSGAELASIIKNIAGVGEVAVEFKVMDLCLLSGCGVGIDRGFGYVYIISLLDASSEKPLMFIEDISFTGGAVVNGSFGETSNNQDFQVITTSTLIREGLTLAVSDSSLKSGKNQWLTPFWILLFDGLSSPPPRDLASAIRSAAWSRKFQDSFEPLRQVILLSPIPTKTLRVQRDGEGSLSITELEIFSENLNCLSEYTMLSQVLSSPVTRPYQSETPLGIIFRDMKYDGPWILEISTGNGSRTGTVSDWVLIITDLTGIVHAYYQDLKSIVTSMPQFGRLYSSTPATSSPYGGWRDLFELIPGHEFITDEPSEMYQGNCLGVDTSGLNGIRSPQNGYRFCSETYGMRPSLNRRLAGDIPAHQVTRQERVIIYRPNPGYKGLDSFTYSIADGLSTQVGTSGYLSFQVVSHVRYCRSDSTISNNILHSLCECSQNENSLTGDPACAISRARVCKDKSSFAHFSQMCLSCKDPFSSGCKSETTRAVYFLRLNGSCLGLDFSSCQDEIQSVQSSLNPRIQTTVYPRSMKTHF